VAFPELRRRYLERTGADSSGIADTAFVAVNNHLQNQIMETSVHRGAGTGKS
jgi:hypothetical protein